MKKASLAILLSLPFTTWGGTSLVSDFDDTIKITNAGDALEAGVNGLFTQSVYTGMPQFLREVDTYAEEIHIVTGSPGIINSKVHGLLRKHDIRYDSVSFRNPLREKTAVYKTRVIKAILENSSDDFILIGDDVDQDHLIYDGIKSLYPNRILAIYIHAVKNREVPSSAVRYWTSFDLTLREILAGRMNPESLLPALNTILDEQKLQRIFPRFADCPSQAVVWEWQTQTIFSPEAQKVSEKLINYCTYRDVTTGKL